MNCVSDTLKLVKFINIQDFVINFDNPGQITVDYTVDNKVRVTMKDWIAIFPEGCNIRSSLDLDLLIAYEFVLRQPVDKQERRYRMQLSLKGVKSLQPGHCYQFVYYNSFFAEVVGVSEVFRFFESVPSTPAALIKPQTNNREVNKTSVEGDISKTNKTGKNCQTKQDQKVAATETALTRRNEKEMTKDEVDHFDQQVRNFNKNRKNKQGIVNRVNNMATYGSNSDTRMVPNCKALNSVCSNCHRVGALLATQADLYRQVKNLAEMNSDLEQQVTHLLHQLELGQAAYQKLSVSLMHERDWKHFYQAAVREQYQVVVVDQMAEGLLTVRQPSHEMQRSTEKAKFGSLRLKAIIGSQEEKIRSLTNQLAKLQIGDQVQKVRAIVKDMDQLEYATSSFNNNDGEAE